MILSEAETSPRITTECGGKKSRKTSDYFLNEKHLTWRERLHVNLDSFDLSGTSREMQPSREKRDGEGE